ncbi:hypothetical protein F511_03084 [Dorcoceras hygrometricum]|nr:hypothetical protein F511_03084 [Dorcoceras hygrometricum]
MDPSHNPRTILSSLRADLDQRPLMLKDFLRDDDRSHSCSSSSSPISSDQMWYPIKMSRNSNGPSNVQLLSRSKSAAMHTIFAFHKVVNLVKMIPFTSRGKGRNDSSQDFPETKVKVKDILRWTSFRDLDVDKSTPLDHLTSITMDSASGRSSVSSSSSSGLKSSSWSQSDLTADDLPFWCNENKDRYFNDRDDMLRKIPKEEWEFEESDQQTPVSVLHDSLFLENEGPVRPCHTNASFGYSEGVMDEVKEQAKRLLTEVKETDGESHDDHLMLDFFEYELSTYGKSDDLEINGRIVEVAKSWEKGECKELFDWESEDRREAFVRDMEREVGWNKFSCEVEAMCKELQIELWSELLCEVLNDFHAE